MRQFLPSLDKISKHINKIRNAQKDKIITLIENNSGFSRPLLDNHSISILLIFIFFSNKSDLRQKDVNFLAKSIFGVITGLLVIKIQRGRMPEGYNRIDLVSEFVSTGEKPDDYTDESSMLIAILFELLVLFDAKDMYENLKNHLDNKVNLQIAHPHFKNCDIEQFMFEKHMDREYYIESDFALPDNFDEFKNKVKEKEYDTIDYRTDNAGFPFLRTLAHKFYKNEIFPNEWREVIAKA